MDVKTDDILRILGLRRMGDMRMDLKTITHKYNHHYKVDNRVTDGDVTKAVLNSEKLGLIERHYDVETNITTYSVKKQEESNSYQAQDVKVTVGGEEVIGLNNGGYFIEGEITEDIREELDFKRGFKTVDVFIPGEIRDIEIKGVVEIATQEEIDEFENFGKGSDKDLTPINLISEMNKEIDKGKNEEIAGFLSNIPNGDIMGKIAKEISKKTYSVYGMSSLKQEPSGILNNPYLKDDPNWVEGSGWENHQQSKGKYLDNLAYYSGVQRFNGETDESLRQRILDKRNGKSINSTVTIESNEKVRSPRITIPVMDKGKFVEREITELQLKDLSKDKTYLISYSHSVGVEVVRTYPGGNVIGYLKR